MILLREVEPCVAYLNKLTSVGPQNPLYKTSECTCNMLLIKDWSSSSFLKVVNSTFVSFDVMSIQHLVNAIFDLLNN